MSGINLTQVANALSSATQVKNATQLAVAVKGKQIMEQQGENALELIQSAATGKGLYVDARA